MILIVTLNPLLERRLTYKSIQSGKVNRNPSFIIKPGGKGINVSRQLSKLGLSSYNLIFSGGNDGKIYRDVLRKEGFEFSSVQIQDETRFAAIAIDESRNEMTSFFSSDPTVKKKECDEFINRLDRMIRNCDIVVFAGSSPDGAEEIVPAGIELANKYDRVSICDTYGQNLVNALNNSPTIVHNNTDEIRTSLKLSLSNENEITSLLNSFYSKGIKRSYITDGPNHFYASNFDYLYKITPPKIDSVDTTGSGDSFVAGIIYGWHNNLVFEDSLRLAVSLAAINASTFEVSNANPVEAEKLSESVLIESIGKKIKTIDDTPH